MNNNTTTEYTYACDDNTTYEYITFDYDLFTKAFSFQSEKEIPFYQKYLKT